MAGDRGLLHPELPASAMRDVAAELSGRQIEAHVCSNRTCEIALQQTTGAPYASFVLLLERLTRPRLAGHANSPDAPSREEVLE
jgi:D-lactate dehydrogenase